MIVSKSSILSCQTFSSLTNLLAGRLFSILNSQFSIFN
ncbi:Uncharacterized protein dnm_071430 [Desulfonema magnum]|uniref:Uncharacterized protein n=1 Tax=Desulfonema magnum TaxID=45655 RepID=A0A975GSH1_9BACT|nr:Uncharacterized protein dnm_071430 [Desulfonema magnum]